MDRSRRYEDRVRTGPAAGQSEPTLRDVAGRASVSPMTVSGALRDDPRVSDTTRHRVLAAVEELGYRRNELARNLRLGRTSGLVGLVVTLRRPGTCPTTWCARWASPAA
jgi:LacI family transcriptional regulator